MNSRSRSEVIKAWVLGGLFLAGPMFGLILVNNQDFVSHSLTSKILTFSACVLLAGPAWGYLCGIWFWRIMKRWGCTRPGQK